MTMTPERARSCAGKAAYLSRDAAEWHAAPDDHGPVTAYDCKFCDWWHLGHKGGGGRIGIPWQEARTVRVVARMRQGAILHRDWPLPLDGLLASMARREMLGDRHGSQADHQVADLPLAVFAMGGQPGGITKPARRRGSGAWTWAASCARPGDGAVQDVHWWHRRVPHAAAERVAGTRLPPMIYEGHGRYRAHRQALAVTATLTLEWTVIGDPQRLAPLLERAWCAGKKRSQGEGAVLDWRLGDLGPADPDAVRWTPGGRIARPFPARYAAALGLESPEVTGGAYRPPYFRPAITERGVREWLPVIAPWTRRPA